MGPPMKKRGRRTTARYALVEFLVFTALTLSTSALGAALGGGKNIDCSSPTDFPAGSYCTALRSAIAAENQAVIYGKQLSWMRLEVILASIGIAVTAWAARSAASAARSARVSVDANRRPKLLVREMILTRIGDHSLTIESVVANAGDAAAIIVESFVDIQSVDPHRWEPQRITEGTNILGAVHIEPGAQHRWTIEVAIGDGTLIGLAYAEQVANARDMHEAHALAIGLWLRGAVVYADAAGIRRRTAFFRRLNAWTRRFYSPGPDTSDYEYSD